jgi:hypothetical protein
MRKLPPLFTSQLGTSLAPAEVEFTPMSHFYNNGTEMAPGRPLYGNGLQAISTAATTKVNLGVLKLGTFSNRDVQDVCQRLPSIGNIRHLVLHCLHMPMANERTHRQLDRLLVALHANGSLVTLD